MGKIVGQLLTCEVLTELLVGLDGLERGDQRLGVQLLVLGKDGGWVGEQRGLLSLVCVVHLIFKRLLTNFRLQKQILIYNYSLHQSRSIHLELERLKI